MPEPVYRYPQEVKSKCNECVGKDKVQGLCASKAVIISLKKGYKGYIVSGGSVTNICIHL